MSESPDILVVPARAAELIDLRHAILRRGFPRAEAMFPGDDDATARHFAARVAGGDRSTGKLVGCVTLHLNDWKGEPAYQLRGMAVDPSLQRRGIGRLLLEAVDAFVRSPQGRTRLLWCNARTPAIPFYGAHGWQVVSDVFEIPASGPHVKMIRRL